MYEMNTERDICCASDVTPKEIKWLWYPYIPYGKVTVIVGESGDGKSLFALNLAALVTRGEAIPFSDKRFDCLNVIYQNSEDDIEDTVVPRFIDACGDRDKLFYINEENQFLTLDDTCIEDAIRRTNAGLVIFDPLVSYLGGGCSMNMANEIRAKFNPIIKAAQRTGAAIVIVHHLNKNRGQNAKDRGSGSGDIMAAARSGLLIARTGKSDDDPRALASVKSNLAKNAKTILFRFDDNGRIEFLEESDKTADELVGNSFGDGAGRPDTQIEKAKEIILSMLKEGPRTATEIFSAIEHAGVGKHTANNAKKFLGVQSIKSGTGEWLWQLK